MKKTILRILPRLLPAGALFLPLGTLTISLGSLFSKPTAYNIVGLIKTFGSESNELFVNLLKGDSMAPARPWLIVTVVGLALGILAILAGLALPWRESVKRLGASAAVYAGGTAGVILAVVGFSRFGTLLTEAVRLASTSLNAGTWILMALLLLNAAVCFAQWRAAREKARLAALAAKKRKRK
jgi:hypothetical protein